MRARAPRATFSGFRYPIRVPARGALLDAQGSPRTSCSPASWCQILRLEQRSKAQEGAKDRGGERKRITKHISRDGEEASGGVRGVDKWGEGNGAWGSSCLRRVVVISA